MAGNPSAIGLFTEKRVYLAENRSLPDCMEIIAHEYLHYIQRKYFPGWFQKEIVEGFAVWGTYLVLKFLNAEEMLYRLISGWRFYSFSEYQLGFSFFFNMEQKYSIEGVLLWMKTLNSDDFPRIVKAEFGVLPEDLKVTG